MKEQQTIVFDFDRTLTTTDTFKFLFVALLVLKPWRILKLVRLRNNAGATKQNIKNKTMEVLLSGISKKNVDYSINIYCFITKFFLRKGIVAYIQRCIQSGDLIIIASASPTFALCALYKNVNIRIIGSEYEIKKGRYTGRLKEPSSYGFEKASKVSDYCVKNKLPTISLAFSDHYSDFPLLSLAQKAFLVNPDAVTVSKNSEFKAVIISEQYFYDAI